MGDHSDDYMRRQMREQADAEMRLLKKPKLLGGAKALRKRYPGISRATARFDGKDMIVEEVEEAFIMRFCENLEHCYQVGKNSGETNTPSKFIGGLCRELLARK